MKKIRETSKKTTPNKKLQWYSFEEVFKTASRSKEFQRAYNEELQRLRLAKQIRALRFAQHLTQKVVARRAGMPQSVIARIESGQKGISLDTLGRVAHAFGKDIQLA
ncbi:MAG: helix-turn-helix transcriptional regulator [bacterium]|nr:helix-turn-helix transcriptional regulator [bacterium]